MRAPVARRQRGDAVPGKWLSRRVVARAAAAGLALGLTALASLSVLSNVTTQHATREVRTLNAVTSAWGQVFVRLSAEDAALREFIATGGTEYRREPLAATVNSAASSLDRVAQLDGAEAAQVELVRGDYRGYTRIVVELLDTAARGDSIQGYAELAALSFAPLREHVVGQIDRKRQELTSYLDAVDRRNVAQRWVTTGMIAVDLFLLLVCSVFLIGYQRRVERQAEVSRHDATHDSLTGLGNRVLLHRWIADGITEADRTGRPIGLLVIELNRFKEVNDTLGHHCGDLLLQAVAERLRSAARATDGVARLGGDEFAVVLREVPSAARAAEVAARVLAALRQPLSLDGVPVDVDASIGVATYPLDSATSDELLQHADVAMYQAKRGGTGVAGYDAAADHNTTDRLTRQSELRRGIERGELVLHYQPKINLRTGRAVGVEALVRWQHPDRGLLLPDAFIALAEESDLIERLTTEVLTLALREAGTWLQAGSQLGVAINVPARCLLDAELPAQVATALARYRVPPELLTIEITESALITDPDRATAVLEELRSFGVKLSIDDFGTGYSSLAYLKVMPLDELKIDRSFVGTMCTDPRNETIVRSVIDMARNLHLRVVAEGVEDEMTLAALTGLGCDVVQGYHLSRPVPADRLGAWLITEDQPRMLAIQR